jgi:hypothetical protein
MKIFLLIQSIILALSLQISAQDYIPTYFSKSEFDEDVRFLAQKVTGIHPKFLDRDFYGRWKSCLSIQSLQKTS